ncbi:unnamed protein product [Thlaspi arvense]|uniref:DUF3741 domain-containing protein n=1 Tax=Thlaspi arvense TaxID=13288 RepID=A0AAU9S4X6_THLAR|nr:unnamed protein product [Thlaspi arvense]
MIMIETEAVEGKRSRGGFLHLFDWPGKSRKKLFSSTTTSELSGASKQEKQNAQNLLKSWPSLIDGDEIGKNSTYNLRSDSSCSTSTVTSDDGQVSRSPSVVARLMGLESLPRSSSELEPFFHRSSCKTSTWDAYENLGYVNLCTDYDGISWDHLDSRMNLERNRPPINRFQTETLPPRSTKPISVTHNRLLSPIRSPGFVQSRNPAYVMEAASRMIEPSPRVAAKARFSSSDSSSSLPMSIRDLKEKLEASPKRPTPQISNGTCNNKNSRGKHDEKRTTSSVKTQETNKLLGKTSFDGLKGKVKPPSHARANTIHKQSMPTSGNRGTKETMETKNSVMKNSLKESSASTGKTVAKPNNQKQNQFAVTSVSNQKGGKLMNKVVNKVLVESGTTSKKPGFTATSVEKNTTLSLPRKKILPRNKKPQNGGMQEPGMSSDKRIKRGEQSIKCNITVDGSFKTGEDDRKKDMDVILFTFSSPIKGISSGSRYSTEKTNQDRYAIDDDSLNILLEQKLRELTSKIESSCSSLTQEEESSGSISKDWVNGTISLPSDDLDKVPSESESVSDSTSFYNNQIFQTNTVGVDNTFRKKFDTEEYRERARERERKLNHAGFTSRCRSRIGLNLGVGFAFAAKGPPVQRAPLKHRDYHVDLESRLGKTQVVTPVAPLSQQAKLFMFPTDQRALGMSMRVERSSLEQVQERFEVLKKRKTPGTFTEQENRNYSVMHSRFGITEFDHDLGIDLDERIRKQQEEEEELKRQRREKKKEKKARKAMEEEPEMDPEVAEMMGFGGFGSSKKS